MENVVKIDGERVLTRREFLRAAGRAGAAAIVGYSFLAKPVSGSPTRSISMIHWSHFVPAYNPELERQVTEWSARRGATARVDFVAYRDIPAKLAAEAESRTGHDVVQLRVFDAALYRQHLVPLDDVAQEVERESGPWLPLARYLGFLDGRWYGVPWYYWSFPATINTEHWGAIGMGAANVAALDWNAFLEAAERLYRRGTPVGMAISQTFDANDALYPLLWSFGGRTVDEKGNVVIDSAETAAAIEYAKRLFRLMPRDVLGWDDAANNRFILAGVGSWTPNAPSIWAVAKLQNLPIAGKIDHVPMPRGPKGRFRSASTLALGVWKFSRNVELAKDLIRHLLSPANYARQVEASMGYNQPFLRKLGQHAYWRNEPVLRFYEPVREQLAVPGWPGPAGEGAQLVYTAFIVPLMFAKAVTGEMSTAEAIRWAARELQARYRR
jgi:multiple sugar transport system substrate-binding protein